MDSGFIWSDVLRSLGRIRDHSSKIAGCVLDLESGDRNTHESLRTIKTDSESFWEQYRAYGKKYSLNDAGEKLS